LPFRTIRRKGFDSGLFRPSLRAGLESLDRLGTLSKVEGRVRKHPVETCNKDSYLFAGAYSRILRIREICRLVRHESPCHVFTVRMSTSLLFELRERTLQGIPEIGCHPCASTFSLYASLLSTIILLIISGYYSAIDHQNSGTFVHTPDIETTVYRSFVLPFLTMQGSRHIPHTRLLRFYNPRMDTSVLKLFLLTHQSRS
jgi:hypothetical protein